MGKFADFRLEVRELFFSRNPDQQEIKDVHIDRCGQVAIKQFSRWKPRKNISGVANVVNASSQILLPLDFIGADINTLLWAATGNNPPDASVVIAGGYPLLSVFDSYLADTGYLPITGQQYYAVGGLTGIVGAGMQVSVRLTTNSDGRYVIETGVNQTETTTRNIFYTGKHILTDTVYTVPEDYKDSFLLFVLHYIYKGLANDSLIKVGSKRTQQYSQFWNTLANEALKEAKKETGSLGFLS